MACFDFDSEDGAIQLSLLNKHQWAVMDTAHVVKNVRFGGDGLKRAGFYIFALKKNKLPGCGGGEPLDSRTAAGP